MKKYCEILYIFFLILSGNLNAQVGIGNTDPDASSILDITAEDKGILIPRMTSVVRDGIVTPASGLLIYNTTDLGFNYYESGWKTFSPAYYEVNAILPATIISNLDVVILGMSISPKAGNYLAQFNAQYEIFPIAITAQAKTNLLTVLDTFDKIGTASSTVAGYTTTAAHALIFSDTEVVGPGIYQIAGAGSITGTITLDGQDNPDALFVFNINGAFDTGAGAVVKLTRGAKASNVFWIPVGAVGLGAGTIMKGTMISKGSAIGIGADCIIDGRMFTTAGAIGIGPGTAKIPVDPSLVDLGILNSFVMFTSIGGIGNTGVSTITGDIGTNNGSITTFGSNPANVNGTVNGKFFYPGDVNTIATFSIYQNGIQIPSTIKTRIPSLNTVDISMQTLVTIEATKTIEVRSNVDFGSMVFTNRSLSIIKVK